MTGSSNGSTDERVIQVRKVILDCLARRSEGETLPDADIEAEFPHLAPELGQQLRLAAFAEAARHQADLHNHTDTPARLARDATTSNTSSQHGESSFPIRQQPGMTIGRFELIERLGHGGFATVWKARDPQLDRLVALKVPKNLELSASEAELFLREARAASQVHHPNVVGIHEVGRDSELIYLVCDLVSGLPLDQWLRDQPVTHRQAVQLCETIALALAAVHKAGIVHRDLKPSNILIEDSGTPYLTDFGLAKRGEAEATLTIAGQMLGTPAYMSPEQARGESHQAEVPSDIYSLGVILFELATGVLPFRGPSHRIITQTVHDEAPSPRNFDASIPRDLETICLRCLEKDPAKRFASASDLAEELGRFLRNEPILSRPISKVRRAARWCRRKPVAAALVGVLILSAVLGPVVAVRERRLTQEAVTARQETESQKAISTKNERKALRNAYAANMNLVQNALADRNVLLAKQLLEVHLPSPGQEDLRGFEWRYLWKKCHRGSLGSMKADWPIRSLCISDDGRYAGVSHGSSTALFDIDKGQRVAIKDNGMSSTSGIHFGQDSERLFSIKGSGHLAWWDPFDDKSANVSTDQTLRTITRLPNDAGFATGGDDGIIEIWSNQPDQPTRTMKLPGQFQCRALAASPLGDSIAAVGWMDGNRDWKSELFLYDVETGGVLWQRTFDSASEACVHFSPDGRLIAVQSHSGGGAPRLGNTETGEVAQTLEARSDVFTWVAFSPDGTRLAAFADRAGSVTLWDIKSGKLIEAALPHPGTTCAAWRDNKTLVTGGMDGYLRTWAIDSPEPRTVLKSETANEFWHSTSTPDGYTVLTCTSLDNSELWEIKSKCCRFVFPELHKNFALMPDGQTMFAKSMSGKVILEYNQKTDEPRTLYAPPRDDRVVSAPAVSQDGRWLAIGEKGIVGDPTGNFDVILLDLQQDKVLCRFSVEPYGISQMMFSHDGETLLAVDLLATLRAWDINTQTQIMELSVRVNESRITSVACHPHRPLVALGNHIGVIQLVDFSTGTHTQSYYSYGNGIREITFSPDGHTLIAACGNFSTSEEVSGEIRFWDLESGHSIISLGEDLGVPVGVVMTSDGQYMTTTHHDGHLVIWEGADDAEVALQRSPQ